MSDKTADGEDVRTHSYKPMIFVIFVCVLPSVNVRGCVARNVPRLSFFFNIHCMSTQAQTPVNKIDPDL